MDYAHLTMSFRRNGKLQIFQGVWQSTVRVLPDKDYSNTRVVGTGFLLQLVSTEFPTYSATELTTYPSDLR